MTLPHVAMPQAKGWGEMDLADIGFVSESCFNERAAWSER